MERGDEEGLRSLAEGPRSLADSGDENAQFLLADLLRRKGDQEGLRSRVRKGDSDALYQLGLLLIGRVYEKYPQARVGSESGKRCALGPTAVRRKPNTGTRRC